MSVSKLRYALREDTHPHSLLIPKPVLAEMGRPKLLEFLENASDYTLIALLAPSGFGKTTLLAQHARTSSRPLAWLTLDEEHRVPHVLYRDMVAVIQQTVPELDLQAVRQALAVRSSPRESGRALAKALNELDRNMHVVLDGLHHLGPDSEEGLVALLMSLTAGHQILIAGYDPGTLPLTRLIVRGKALLLTQKDLAFSAHEARVFLDERKYKGDVEAALDAVEGWPAGLALIAVGGAPTATPERFLYDIMDRIGPEIREALAEASVLSIWNEHRFRKIGITLSNASLVALGQAGLPIEDLDGVSFRPHTFLLRSLQTLLKYTPERYSHLHRLAAGLSEEEGDVIAALSHYREAGVTDQMVRLTSRIVPALEAEGRVRLVREVLQSLPSDQLPPDLAVSLAHAYVETGKLHRAELLLRTLEPEPGVLAAQATVAIMRGEFSTTLELTDIALARDPDRLVRLRLLRLRSAGLLGTGATDDALAALQSLVKEADETGKRNELRKALTALSLALFQAERRAECERMTLQTLALSAELGQHEGTPILHYALANLYLLQDRVEEAMSSIQQGLTLLDEEDYLHRALLLCTKGDIYLWRGSFDSARDIYLEVLSQLDGRGYQALEVLLRYKLSEAARRTDRTDLCAQALAGARAVTSSEYPPRDLRCFYEGLAAFNLQTLDEAQRSFEEAYELTTAPDLRVRALGYIAEIESRKGRLTDARITQLVAALNALGTDAVLRIDAPVLTSLYGILATTERFSARFAPFVQDTSLIYPLQPVLTIGLSGPFEVRINGGVVRIPFSKAKEVLAWLVLHGPASRDAIVDALWGAEPDPRNVDYFKVSVRRLRTALAAYPAVTFNPLVYENGLYQLAREFEITCDITCLRHALATGTDADLRTALDMYRGKPFASLETEWVQDLCLQAQEQAAQVAWRLGESLRPRDAQEAVRAYRRALEIEPLFDEAHLSLIRLLEHLGDEAGALLAYQSYAGILRRELDVNPPADLCRRYEPRRRSQEDPQAC